MTKTAIIILILILAGLTAVFFWQPVAMPDEDKIEPTIFNAESYADAAREIARQINDLSPTPPTEQTWTVREIEFVKNEPYAYVTYHDTHNIFRILLETNGKPYAPEQTNRYRTIATFEAAETGWRLAHGQDLAKGKETVKINPN